MTDFELNRIFIQWKIFRDLKWSWELLYSKYRQWFSNFSAFSEFDFSLITARMLPSEKCQTIS